MPASSSSSSLRQREPACDRCRTRKQKCDRTPFSCTNCRLAAVDCIYPPGKGRAPKRARVAAGGSADQLSPHIIERLLRLEESIRQISAASKPENALSSIEASHAPPSFGRLFIDDRSSYYVNNVLWSILANKVKSLSNELTTGPTDDDTLSTTRSSSSGGHSDAAVLGYYSLSKSLKSLHPQLPVSATLFPIFVDNVAPIVSIFHLPTLTKVYWDAVAAFEDIDRETEALLFAINYAAVTSLTAEQCQQYLGEPRDEASDRYRFAAEQALARAGLLNTQSLTVLQAAVVFLNALRNQDETRTTWSLTALVYHIAQAMGLHRDGEKFGLKPFETEMRRRLWWQICILDNRSSEYHGYESIVQPLDFDTHVPLHINDDDLHIDSKEAPAEVCNECTDMTFTLIRCEALKAGWSLGVKTGQTTMAPSHSKRVLENLEDTLEGKYLSYCDHSSVDFHRVVSSAVARLIIARFKMVRLHYPRADSVQAEGEEAVRSQLLHGSVKILDACGKLLTGPESSRWAWYSKTYIQWGALGFVLSDLCTNPRSKYAEKAWAVVSTAYDAWEIGQNTTKDNLSLPLQRLMAEARHVRQHPSTPLRTSAGHVAMLNDLESSMTPTEKMALWQRQATACWESFDSGSAADARVPSSAKVAVDVGPG